VREVRQAMVSSSWSSANRASAKPGWLKNFAAGSARRDAALMDRMEFFATVSEHAAASRSSLGTRQVRRSRSCAGSSSSNQFLLRLSSRPSSFGQRRELCVPDARRQFKRVEFRPFFSHRGDFEWSSSSVHGRRANGSRHASFRMALR
jgi:hypothetical protein